MVRVGISDLCVGWLILKDGLMLRVVALQCWPSAAESKPH